MATTIPYENATGKIDYTLKNDYMFHAVLQENHKALRGFLCSLLRLNPRSIRKITILNPIVIGKRIDAKKYIMDIRILLNTNQIICLEMQVVNEHNWPDRSLLYLCRSYDSLMIGQDYKKAKSAIHISILDFTLFKEHPEFYAAYKMMNVKNHHIYNGKFQLNVLCLNQTKLATDEDKAAGLDQWAALFRATTWEELKMAAKKSSSLQEAARDLYVANGDYNIRYMAECYAENQRLERIRLEKERDLKQRLAAKDAIIAEKDKTLATKDNVIAEKASENALLRAELERLRVQLNRQ